MATPSLNSADFKRLSRLGKKCALPAFILLALRQADAAAPFRLGLTVSRKVGNAVVRNRAKRRLRALVSLYEAPEKLVGWDIVLIARATARERDFALLRQDFGQGLEKTGVAP
ncbi:MAG: ribonuclease P protein component [Alphaproteobacteria bacterium]|nr:ribonuclease P protein component [Alphaproteobacteria bacterium]MDE2335811.1 ribonuclease P protein component [Alphaproteobacteria bacterium]